MLDLAREIVGTQPILAAFLAIGLGYLVGQINLGGFSLGVGFSSTRQRPTPGVVVPKAGQQILTLNGTFTPTAHWNASWNTRFDMGTRQFQDQQVNLERDLHRWHASFSFLKAPNGNLAFSVYVALLDQPDIKFDYEQRSFAQ